MSDRFIRILIPALLVAYFGIGFGRWLTYRPEVYPVAAWMMFQRPSRRTFDYDILLHRDGDRTFVPPVSVRDHPEILAVALGGHQKLVLNGFARFTHRKRIEETERYRRFIDRQIVGADRRYEIVRIKEHARADRQHLDETRRFGPFDTAAGLPPPDPSARFEFPDWDRRHVKFARSERSKGITHKQRKSLE